MTPLGEAKFFFSEPVKPIDELEYLNKTVISNDGFFRILYHSYVETENDEMMEDKINGSKEEYKAPKIIPELSNWWIRNFTSTELTF